jgi:hypothetical protein
MSVRELEVKINTIKDSDEYVKLLTRNRGPLEERRLRELDMRMKAFQVQLGALQAAEKSANASSTPFRPALVTRGLPQARSNAKSAVAQAAIQQQAAAHRVHVGLKPAPLRPGQRIGGFMNPAVGVAEPAHAPVAKPETGKFGMKPRGSTVGQIKADINAKYNRTENPLPAPIESIFDEFGVNY